MPSAATPKITCAYDQPLQLAESPLWSADEQALYWIDISACELHRLHPVSKSHNFWQLPSEPGCLASDASGGLIIALRTGIVHLDPGSGAIEPLLSAPYDQQAERFNDGRCDPAGRLWVGSLREQRDGPLAALYCIEHGAIRDAGPRATVSNGVAFSPDGRTLYHTDTSAHAIHAYPFDASHGTLGEARLFHQFPNDRNASDYGGRPDGAAVDSEGGYWCAMYEGGRILRFAPDGTLLREIHLPVRCPTMPAFGGVDLRTLYVTTVRHGRPKAELQELPLSGYLLSLQVDVRGCLETAYIRGGGPVQ
ncbi:MAG: SMP-30/gluconolactonase/LRE family protein [Herbaspirillum sp.]